MSRRRRAWSRPAISRTISGGSPRSTGSSRRWSRTSRSSAPSTPGSRRARKHGSVVSSNTSTLPLAKLTEGLPESFARDFLITHFFNPPRYMRLLEIVRGRRRGPRPSRRSPISPTVRLGKSVVPARTRPGFIANRIGSYWMQAAFTAAFEMGLPVEEADAVLGRPLGIPKTGIFGLADLVGIDLLPHVAASLRAALPPDDPFHAVDREWPLIEEMIETGYTGRKGKGGFYRLNTAGGERIKEAIDLETGEYHAARQAAARLRRCGQGRRPARPARGRRAGGALRLAGHGRHARLCLLAGARDRRRHRRGRSAPCGSATTGNGARSS